MSKDAGLALYRLLPKGECWPDENEDSNLKNLIYGISKNVEDFINTAELTMEQYYPGQSGVFVEDWEALLGLPKCGQTEQILQVRLAQILAMFRISPYSNAEFFEEIALVFGFNVTIIPTTIVDPEDVFTITIQTDSIEEIEFRAGLSSAGDPLSKTQTTNDVEGNVLECVLNFFKQSHTNLVFTI